MTKDKSAQDPSLVSLFRGDTSYATRREDVLRSTGSDHQSLFDGLKLSLETLPQSFGLSERLFLAGLLIEEAAFSCAHLKTGQETAALILLAAQVEREAERQANL